MAKAKSRSVTFQKITFGKRKKGKHAKAVNKRVKTNHKKYIGQGR